MHKSPSLAIDVIINYKRGVVLIKRRNPPFGWALPGGFVDYGERVEDAARREMREETSLELEGLRLFGVYSEPERDPRGHVVSVVFTAKGKGEVKSGDDAKEVGIFEKDNLPEDIAFDHREILMDYFLKGGKNEKI